LITSTFVYQLFFSGGQFGVGNGEYVRQCDLGIDSTFYNTSNNNYVFYAVELDAWALWDAQLDDIAYVSYGSPTDQTSLLNWESYAYVVGTAQARYWSRNSTNSLIPAS
jgi:hypothetical protein